VHPGGFSMSSGRPCSSSRAASEAVTSTGTASAAASGFSAAIISKASVYARAKPKRWRYPSARAASESQQAARSNPSCPAAKRA